MQAVRHIPEHPGIGRLGRHVNHDVRSLGFIYQPRKLVPITSVLWPRVIPILDQGNLGSCTGNAMCGGLGTNPVEPALPADHPVLDEATAVHIYSDATLIDPYPGSYPPIDTGSDGVSVAQVAKNHGWISGYQHCLDLDTMLQALMAGPVLMGINWYSSFDAPAADGTVEILPDAYVRGGHEVLARGVDAELSMIELDNSWGPGWGSEGRLRFSFGTARRLLAEQGDATVPLPLTVAPPKPTPVIVITDGTKSLLQYSVKYGSPCSTILRTTLQQFVKFSAGISRYLQGANLAAPMPAGESLCLAWPEHQIV